MGKREDKRDIKRFNPSIEQGLTSEEANYMREHGKINIMKNPTNKSYFSIIFGNIFTFFNILMFAIAGLLVLIVGPKVVTNLMFLLIIITNILIGTIQECKSKHTIEKLKLLSSNRIRVVRDGTTLDLLANDIVLDDIVILSPGDQIPVDCIILDSDIVEVNEALLTGESVPVKKTLGNILYAGSFIVSGSVHVRADKIGGDTYIASIEKKAKLAKQPKSRLMIAIRKVINSMAFIAIPLSLIVFVNEFLQGVIVNPTSLPLFPSYWGEESIATSAVFYGGTTITYMIPCGMALLASVAMTTGVVKLAQNKTLAQDLYSVESLSRVDTLCLDKTGTLTDGTMVLDRFDIINDKYDETEVGLIMSSYLSAFKSTNQTSTALINKFGTVVDLGINTPESQTSSALLGQFAERRNIKISDTIEFSSSRKFSAVEFDNKGWFALGAPEYLTKDAEILNKVNEYAKVGLRVVILTKVNEDFTDRDILPEDKTPVAMFVIRDNIRPEVKDTMVWFRNNDVDIKVISGDNVGTVSYIAKQSGIENWDKTFDMSTLTPEDDLEQIVMNNAIFGRVTPDQKADIIAILKKNKRVVGVTGDGLNDLLAFKQADCSIALANGAAATKNVANLVLLDSNFANMKEAVFQGRRVVNNVQRSSSLFVMKDFLWLFITLLPILLGVPHMVQPTVMTVVNVFITGIASVFISLEPDKTRVKGNFYRNVVERAIVSGFYMFLPVLFIIAYVIVSEIARTQTYDVSSLETIIVDKTITSLGWLPVIALCVSIAGFIVFFEDCRPFTKFRKVLYASTLGVVILILYLAPEFYIISGTKMLKETVDSNILKIFPYIFEHLEANLSLAIYRTMTTEQLIFMGAYVVLAYPLFLLNKKLTTRVVSHMLFSNRSFSDE